MKSALMSLVLFLLITALPLKGTARAENAAPGTPGTPGTNDNSVLLNRIDFGNSYIMGQSIKSGAVYLLQRKKSEIKSMLEVRTDYREEILEDFSVLDLKITEKKPIHQKP